MHTPVGKTEESFRTRGSRFLGYLIPANDRESFDQVLEEIVSEHPNATHHCYAWRIGTPHPEEFVQDDGEPGGTAGTPILNHLRAAGLTMAACIVVRYFGGTKLGKPGLIEAYGHTTQLCIDRATLQPVTPVGLVRIQYAYPEQNLIDTWKNRYSLLEQQATYLDDVTLTLACPLSRFREFRTELHRAAHRLNEIEELGESWIGGKLS